MDNENFEITGYMKEMVQNGKRNRRRKPRDEDMKEIICF
jgi:hypothetical protein